MTERIDDYIQGRPNDRVGKGRKLRRALKSAKRYLETHPQHAAATKERIDRLKVMIAKHEHWKCQKLASGEVLWTDPRARR